MLNVCRQLLQHNCNRVGRQWLKDSWATWRLLRYWPKAATSKDAIFLFCQRRKLPSFHANLYLLVGSLLAKRGYPAYMIFDDPLLRRYLPQLGCPDGPLSVCIEETRERQGYAYSGTPQEERKYSGAAADSKQILVGGLNLFPEIISSLRRIEKRYAIDFEKPDTAERLRDLISSCSEIFSYLDVLKRFAISREKRVTICGWESAYLPAAAFAKYCETEESKILQYVALDRGYMHYFPGFDPNCSHVTMANLSETRASSRLEVLTSELDALQGPAEKRAIAEGSSDLTAVLEKSRLFTSREEKAPFLAPIKKAHEAGRRVFVLFAHLFFDTGLKETSRSFPDMIDWIIETIEWFRNSKHFLVLKSHPAEEPMNPANLPTQTLLDLVSPLIDTKNMCILPPKSLGIADIEKWMTAGLIWRSSVAMELTYLGVPCVIAGNPPYGALPLCYSKSKDDYFQLLEKAHTMSVTKEQRDLVAKYIYCLKTKHRHIQCLKFDHWNLAPFASACAGKDEELNRLVEDILQSSQLE